MGRELNRISISGYKSIRELKDLELHSLNVLIGANGSGKTNFISLFTMLRQIIEENLQLYVAQSGGANTFLYFGQKTTDEIAIWLVFGANGYRCRLVPASGDTLIFASETCWYEAPEDTQPYVVHMGAGYQETQLHRETRNRPELGILDHVISAMQGWRVYHFHDTSSSAGVKLTGDINDNAVLRPDGDNLAAFLYWLREQQPDHYRQIVNTIRLAAPFFDDFALRPSRLNPTKIQLEWQERGSDAYFDANYLSDGTLRFMCLVTLLLQPELPTTILIDEPELGLHPYAITLLASLIRSAATQTQVIVSTQSVPLVNQFGPEDIIVVDREAGQSVFKRLARADLESWLDDYGMGDLWEKNLLGGRPR
jgi:predicted ATPase